MSSQKRVCVFCGSTPLSREHVWPQWLRSVEGPAAAHRTPHDRTVPKELPRYVRQADGEFQDVSKTRRHSIPPMEAVVRVACRSCNGGWMSRLEQRTKPVLVSIIRNQLERLRPNDATLLATWAYKTAAMMQFDDPHTRTVTNRDLAHLKEHALPGGVTQVHAFQMSTRQNSMRLAHRGTLVAPPGFVGPLPDHANLSSTVLAIERTGFIVTYSAFSHLGTRYLVPPPDVPGLVRLWPKPQHLAWPPPEISSDVAERIFTYIPNSQGATLPFEVI